MSYSDVSIALVTWPNSMERVGYLKQTLDSLRLNLVGYSDMRKACSIESAEYSHWKQCTQILLDHDFSWVSRMDPANLGSNMNLSLRTACAARDEIAFVLLIQDDWILTERLDLRPYCNFLYGKQRFAMVRFSWPEIPDGDERSHWVQWSFFNVGDVEEGTIIDQLDRKSTFFYGDQPQLRRASFSEEYGWFKEGGDHGEPEVDLNGRLKAQGWQIATSHKVLFHHIGEKSSLTTEEQRFGGPRT